jgi:hypothetical protein
MQPMAARLGVDHQALQQFVTSSTWDYQVVRRNVARWAVGAIDPAAYVIDDAGFPKDGTASPLVARQYSGTLGKTGNCQVGVSVQLVTDAASLSANWRLFCPASWDDATITDAAMATAARQRRARAGVPDEVRHRENSQHRVGLRGQELLPGRPGPLRRRVDACPAENVPHRTGRYLVAQADQLTVNAAMPPRQVLGSQPQHQLADLLGDRRAATSRVWIRPMPQHQQFDVLGPAVASWVNICSTWRSRRYTNEALMVSIVPAGPVDLDTAQQVRRLNRVFEPDKRPRPPTPRPASAAHHHAQSHRSKICRPRPAPTLAWDHQGSLR